MQGLYVFMQGGDFAVSAMFNLPSAVVSPIAMIATRLSSGKNATVALPELHQIDKEFRTNQM
jgi:hypothetical protein